MKASGGTYQAYLSSHKPKLSCVCYVTGVITLAGVILGPDLLAGAAVAGVVLLLAVQAGVVQLPAVQLPRLPGQQLMAKQIGKAGKSTPDRLCDYVCCHSFAATGFSNKYGCMLVVISC